MVLSYTVPDNRSNCIRSTLTRSILKGWLCWKIDLHKVEFQKLEIHKVKYTNYRVRLVLGLWLILPFKFQFATHLTCWNLIFQHSRPITLWPTKIWPLVTFNLITIDLASAWLRPDIIHPVIQCTNNNTIQCLIVCAIKSQIIMPSVG